MATKADVERLARSDALVRCFIDAQRYSRGVSWDEMMCGLVVALVDARDAAAALALDCMNRDPTPPVILRRSSRDHLSE